MPTPSPHPTPGVASPSGESIRDLTDRLDALLKQYEPQLAGRPATVTSPAVRPAAPSPPPAPPPAQVEAATAAPAPSARTVILAPATPAAAAVPAAPVAASKVQRPAEPAHASLRALPDELRAACVMIVDDEEVNILAVQHHLKRVGYQQFISTTKPREAMQLIHSRRPDVVLLDIKMPDVSGLDILQAKRLDPALEHIPVLVLTATTDPETKCHALDLGASDFLAKPLDPNELVPRVRNALVVKRHYDQMADQAAKLEDLVRRRTAEVVHTQQQLILCLARAAEHRDNETGNHVVRVGRYAGIIARELGWPEARVEMLQQAAQLHDVGKIGVPDAILFKPGALDPQEYDIIKQHCAWGKGIIEPYSDSEFQALKSHTSLGVSIVHDRRSPMLMLASRIAQTHHEAWDGSGYPLGLAGEDIPLEGRITSVADVYDALSSRRPYKEPFPREKCFAILQEARGKRFDPRVLDAFFARSKEIIEVQLALMDEGAELPHSNLPRTSRP